MKTGMEIGQELKDADSIYTGVRNINAGGNLGMAFIAAAISDHADAIRELAKALAPSGKAQCLDCGSAIEPGDVHTWTPSSGPRVTPLCRDCTMSRIGNCGQGEEDKDV